jgi:chromosome segregation ATPase
MGLFKKSSKEPLATEADLLKLRQQVADLKSQLHEVMAKSAESQNKALKLATTVESLDARITQVGSEVTHQLTELSGDIESLEVRTKQLAEETAKLPSDLSTVLRDQEELALEQARYQIAFRQDLADAIEMLQKKR